MALLGDPENPRKAIYQSYIERLIFDDEIGNALVGISLFLGG
jgi:hypothetical protein